MIIRLVWYLVGFACAIMLLILVWRAQGIIAWNRAIRKELKTLARQAETATPARRKGIRLVQEKCHAILHSLSPWDAVGIDQLRRFVRSIAACYFPDSQRPELQIAFGHLIRSLEASLYRLDLIIQRPGLKRIQSTNIRTIRNLYRWSGELLQRPWMKWFVAHRHILQRFGLVRFLVLPDPFSWLFFLSRKVVTLALIKILLIDITLFVGKLALDAYDRENDGVIEENAEILEETLTNLSQIQVPRTMEDDPAIKAIRKDLVGMSALMFSSPSWHDWKMAVSQAADTIARRHFPTAAKPVEEAAIGPLLQRTRSWLITLGRGENLTLVRYIYKARLEMVFQARDISDIVLSSKVRSILRASLGAYSWFKWPLKIYRRVKRFSLPGVALDIGWVLGKKAAVALIYGRTFDQACRELDWVYRISAEMNAHGVEKPSTGTPDATVDTLQQG